MFTEKQLSQMKEAEFQNRVLIPLFRKMKYRDVTPFDGMSLERGKDLVMWKEGDLRERINYGVLIKAIKVTGKVSGDNSAMEIVNQAKQMLGNGFIDPVTGRKQEIQRCYVVSSQPITKEAMFSIEGELAKDGLNKVLNFVHPQTNLLDLVAEYLPEQSIFEKLADVREGLDESMKDTPYKLVANSEGDVNIFGKHGNATEELPFEVKSSFSFDRDTEKGKEALERFKDHFEKGTPVEIDGEYIESFELPEFLPPWMKPSTTKDSKLLLIPRPSEQTFSWKIERRTSADNQVYSLERIELRVVQQGTKEVTLANAEQYVPWKFRFVFNHETKTFQYKLVCEPYGFNVTSHLNALKFRSAMAEEGETSIIDNDNGLKLVDSDKTQLGNDENLTPWIRVLEALVFIQEKTLTPIVFPERVPTPEETDHIFEVESIIKNGKIDGTLPYVLTRVSLDKARITLDEYRNEGARLMVIRFPEGTKTTILDTLIDLGPTVAAFDVVISNKDFAEIEQKIEKGESEIDFRFTIQTQPFVVDFLKWECGDRHTRMSIVDLDQDPQGESTE